MTVIQTMRNVFDRNPVMPARRSRLLSILSIVLMSTLLSISMASPTMARGGDNDDDGLSNADENRFGTSRTVADTDGDGLLDGFEVYDSLTNPLFWDSDRDGLSDGDEQARGTQPLDIDSDDDGLNDGVEVHVYFTNPLVRDTDNDGLTDFNEVRHYGTTPTLADSDFDNVRDGQDRWPLDSMRF